MSTSRGIKAGYAKFETFPIWNLPLNHPVNLAYEAATADLQRCEHDRPLSIWRPMASPPSTTTVMWRYSRCCGPCSSSILGESPYKSPTDMGVNMAGNCIFDDEAVSDASRREIVRRYYQAMCDLRTGRGEESAVAKIELLMNKAEITVDINPTVAASLRKAEDTGMPAVAIELPDGQVITGKTSSLLGASSAALLNALKVLAGLDDSLHLIAPEVIEPIQHLKISHLGNHNPRLHTDETLIALSISAVTDPNAERAMEHLAELSGCDAHSTVILSQVDTDVFRKLGVNMSCEPRYQTKKLYHKR